MPYDCCVCGRWGEVGLLSLGCATCFELQSDHQPCNVASSYAVDPMIYGSRQIVMGGRRVEEMQNKFGKRGRQAGSCGF